MTKKPFILHLSNRYYSTHAGGTETFLEGLLPALKPCFDQIVLGEQIVKEATLKSGIEYINFGFPTIQVRNSYTRLIEIAFFLISLFLSLFQIIKHWKYFKRADVISYTTGSMNSILNISPLLWLLFPKTPQIYIHHGMPPEAKIYHKKPFKQFFTWAWNKMSGQVFICQSQWNSYKQYGLKLDNPSNNSTSQKNSVIYNWSSLETSIDSLEKASSNSQNNEIHFGAIGRYSEKKGFDLTLQALSQIQTNQKKIFLHIFGDGDQPFYQTLINQLNLETKIKIIWHGFESDKQKIFQTLDCVIFPSYFDSFGLVLVEAYSFGIPVITSSLDAFTEIKNKTNKQINSITEINKLISKTGNLESLTKTIEYYLANTEYFKSTEYKQAVQESVDREFNKDKQLAKYIDYYKQIITKQ